MTLKFRCAAKRNQIPETRLKGRRRVAAVVPMVAILLSGAIAGRGEILGPYTPDEQTLHLWHMNESTIPVVDAKTNGLDLTALENGATLGNESYLGPSGFGTALCTYTGNPNVQPGSGAQDAYLSALPLQNGVGDNVALDYVGPSGSFTYEAIIRIDFDPATSFGPDGWGRGRSTFMQIINADADEVANRVFQFRLAPVGTLNGNTQPLLEFINLNKNIEIQSLTAPIPTDGPDAIGIGNWYHVAVTYDAQSNQPDNLRFYWTLVSPSRIGANLIGSGQMTHSLPVGCQPDFAIGQTGRQSPVASAPNANFVGLIDEVRMSGIARSASQMLFGDRALAVKAPATAPGEPAEGQRANAPEVKAGPAQDNVASVATATPTPSRIGLSASPAPPARKAADSPATVINGVVVRGPVNKHRLAILFSCRDSDAGTPIILDALKSHQAKASFFVSRDYLNWPMNATFARSMSSSGHYVGPQSDKWTQFAKSGLPVAPTDAQIPYPDVETDLKQLASLGIQRKDSRFFLPTSDQLNSTVAQRGRDCGLIMVGGTPGTLSFSTATVEGTKAFASSQDILDSILKLEAQDANGLNGFLLLFPLDSGSRRTDLFYTHFGQLLDDLHQRGYEFVRVDELVHL